MNQFSKQFHRMNRTHRASRLHRAQRIFRSLRLGAGALFAAGALSLTLIGAQGATVAQAAPATANTINTINTSHATAAAQTSSTSGASWLYYKRGYYLDNGWLCYGWANGSYHCTHHWHWANGQLVSDNPAWVPNYGNNPTTTGSSGNGSHVDGDGDYDNDNGDGGSGSNGNGGSGGSGGGSVASMIQSVFGPYAGAALRVATCESSLNPNAYNAGSGASGVFQFLHSTWLTTSYAGYSPFNAWANINAAHQVFVRDGYSWREWSCQP